MKKSLQLFLISLFTVSVVFAQKQTFQPINVIQPVDNPALLYFNNTQHLMHIIGTGDENSAPVWKTCVIASGTAILNTHFEFEINSIKTPLKPGVDELNERIYIPHKDKISVYSMNPSEEPYLGDVADISADAIDVAGSHLLLATNPEEGKRGELKVFNISSSSVLQTVPAGYNFRDVKHYRTKEGGIGIALLSDLEAENSNSVIHYGPIVHMGNFELDSIIIGENAKNIEIQDSMLLVTEPMNDGFATINLNTGEYNQHKVSVGDFQTTESIFKDNSVYTATTYGDIRKTDLIFGNMDDIINSGSNSFDLLERFSTDYLVAADVENNNITFFEKTNKERILERLNITVGKNPADIFYLDNEYVHIFCKGFDANFNGEYDKAEGDEMPSWWRLSIEIPTGSINNINAEKVMDFEFGAFPFAYPINIGLDKKNEIFYIPTKDKILSYHYGNKLGNDAGKSIDVNALSAYWDGYHIIAAEPSSDGNSYVGIYSPGNNSPLMKIEAEKNIAEAIDFDLPNGKKGLCIANIGDFAMNGTSTIQYGEFSHKEEPYLNSYPVGDDIHDLEMRDNLIGMTLNGSHTVKLLNINEGIENIKTLHTGTYGWDGPRDLFFDSNDNLFFTTYAGDFRIINLENNVLTDIIELDAKPEDILTSEKWIDNNSYPAIMVTNFLNHDYSPNNTFTILNMNFSSVKNYKNKEVQTIKLYPNPAVDNITIETDKLLTGNTNIEIFDLQGNLSAEFTTNNLNILNMNLREYNLSSGYYLMRIINNNEIYSIPFEIKK